MTEESDYREGRRQRLDIEELLSPEFYSGRGMLRVGGKFGVQIRAQSGVSAGSVNLEVRLFPPHPAVPDRPDDETLSEWIEELAVQLRSGPKRLRAAACQALGHLDLPKAVEALREVAAREDDSYLSGLAADGLRRLECNRPAGDDLTGRHLWLTYQEGDAEPESIQATTDDSGFAVFEAIPDRVECRLSRQPPEGWNEEHARLRNLARLLSQTLLGEEKSVWVVSHYWRVAASLVAGTDRSDWSIEIEIEARDENWPERMRVRVCAVRANTFWEARATGEGRGRYVVAGLDRAQYAMRLRHCWPSSMVVVGSFLTANSPGPRSELEPPQILHLADLPVVAIFERDGRDKVLVTLRVRESELARRGLRCRLDEEALDIRLEPVEADWWQGHARSVQDYRGDEALRVMIVPLAAPAS